MKSLNIAIDCDDVLVHSTAYLVDTYNIQHGTSVKIEEAYVSENPDWQSEKKEVHRRFNAIQQSQAYGLLAPTSEAIAAIAQLAKHHELHMVTARPEVVATVTCQMVDRYFPKCFSTIEHVGQTTLKTIVYDSIGAEVIIDDNLKHLLDAQDIGVKHLLWFGQYPWQDRTKVPDGVTVVVDWKEASKYIHRASHG